MRRLHVFFWLTSGTFSGLAFLLAGHAAVGHYRHLADERSRLRIVRGYATTIVSMPTGTRQSVGSHASTVTLAERVAAVLAQAGLTHRTLEELSPESSISMSDDTIETRQATMTLTTITLPELGRFLESWLIDEPAWKMAAIDLTPLAGEDALPGSDLPVRAVLKVSSIGAVDQETTP